MGDELILYRSTACQLPCFTFSSGLCKTLRLCSTASSTAIQINTGKNKNMSHILIVCLLWKACSTGTYWMNNIRTVNSFIAIPAACRYNYCIIQDCFFPSWSRKIFLFKILQQSIYWNCKVFFCSLHKLCGKSKIKTFNFSFIVLAT